MALAINTNSGALMAAAAASTAQKSASVSMERLSSGLRINSAKDDAAGVAIASRLTSEIRGTNQAIRNAADGQSLIDTAEGSHIEVVAILQRMRELATQAASDTNSDDDRSSLQDELDALVDEIDRIATVTTWAGQSLLDASGGTSSNGSFVLQVGQGTTSSDTITISIDSISSSTLSVSSLSVSSASGATNAMDSIDDAILTINTQRGELGAVSNRLDHTISNLTNIGTNLEASRSRIEDADFAGESTNLAKAQILQQAATAMLTQANASKQSVLSLLQR